MVNALGAARPAARLLPTLIAAVLLVGAGAAQAQQSSVQGIVLSSSTGSPLEGVAVLLETGGRRVYAAATDRNGFYQIGGIRRGSYSLRGQLLGYKAYERTLTLAGERVRVNFRLDVEPVPIQGIEVSPEKGAAVRDLGRQVVTPIDISRVPVPAGMGDLATFLQTLPGVTTTSDRGGQVFVRGGTPAENLVLVDGIPIVQPFHIVGFFSVFPEDLVSSADFYASGFGARYSGRTSSVLDVRLRDGDPKGFREVASVGPFLAEGLAEGPAGGGASWMASVRRSLIEETSGTLLGQTQPYGFDSELLKVTVPNGDDQRCSGLLLRTSDRGRLDPEETVSHIAWHNLVVGGRCVTQGKGVIRLTEVSFSYTGFANDAVNRGASNFRSNLHKLLNEAHLTSMVGSVPLFVGYHLYGEFSSYDLTELFGIGRQEDAIFGFDSYVESSLPVRRLDLRPGAVLVLAPKPGVEPRLRASWQPFGRSSEKLQAAFGVYRQNMIGISDIRDVTSVFTAWLSSAEGIGGRAVHRRLQAIHSSLGWQQSLGDGLRYSAEGYYKRIQNIAVPVWRATAAFATQITPAEGTSYGADARVEYTRRHLYGFIGYGYSWTQYQAIQGEFPLASWYDQPVQSYHPPHDRRHQVNVIGSYDLGRFRGSVRWQLGTGMPFTRPLGFDQAFDYTRDVYDVSKSFGTARVLMDKPFNGRLPAMHRLDVSVERAFDLPVGKLQVQAGAINVYDRRNMFYYDLYTARRVDQLPFAPYASLTLRAK